jgi:hypothetical protein
MRHQNTVFHGLLKAIPRWRFETIIERLGGDYRVRRLPCWSQFVAMIYAQLAGAQSLRELEATLASHGSRLYHLGVGETIKRSTLSDANAGRPAAIFAEVFALLLDRLRGRLGGEAREVVRLIDATCLPLGETLHAWARFTDTSASAKVHVVYDPAADLPTYFSVTPARVNDIVEAKALPLEAGATYVFDKGYTDFAWWAELNARGCRFVTRLKVNSAHQELSHRPASEPGIVSDTLIRLTQRMARSRTNPYQDTLREVVVRRDNGETLRLVTNDLEAPASEIAQLYKTRWQIELFFKWIKQNLKIRKFLGTSQNAVKIQIITAMIAYLLIRLPQHAWPTTPSLQHLARLIRANLMHRKTIPELLRPPPETEKPPADPQIAMDLGHVHA